MAVLTNWQIFTIGLLGGLAAIVGLILTALLALALYALVARIHEYAATRRALRAGRRRLATFHTIDDLKE
ncbi:hypothetical protein ACFWQ6_00960 [Streptomyces coelicoflavus]|uniref:hypothetical protein n=1 Tax=Streptomyces coelicoflavus TaxID=285562 RepID=UPI00365A877B